MQEYVLWTISFTNKFLCDIMGKTVTTYLIDGDPKGTQYVFISNKICQMYVIPRSNLSILNERPELQTPAFYILLGEDEATKPKAYISETENFRERVKDHDSKNKQTPKAPNLPEYRQDDMEEFFEDVKFLTSFIGCNIFDIAKPKEEHLFYTKGRGCDARGFYDANGFTVLKGSIIAKSSVPSFTWKEKREKLLKDYTIKDGELLKLDSDKTFPSPSTAADFCIGSSNNGWLVWKDKDGQTLDAVYRKLLE